MQKRLQELVTGFYKASQPVKDVPGDTISVSETVSRAASIYEKFRNTLDYQEEHLLRRNAVKRILKRRLDTDSDSEKISEQLLIELIWARYLPNKKIPETMIGIVALIIQKYQNLFVSLASGEKNREEIADWVLDIMSTEIEYRLSPPKKEEALVSYMYQEVKDDIIWSTKVVNEDERELQLFLAVHRALLKSNPATLRYKIFNLYYPGWQRPSADLINEISSNLSLIHETVEKQIKHPIGDSLYRLTKRHVVIFNILRDLVDADPEEFLKLYEDPIKLDHEIIKAADKRYRGFRVRLKRLVFRAVAFLFLTKMLLAIIIELPIDAILLGHIDYYPLMINIMFHPIFLFLTAVTVRIPVKKNNEKIVAGVHDLLYGEKGINIVYKVKRPWTRGTLGVFVNFFYVATFLFSYGLIAYGLTLINFNAVSIGLFLFFFSLVTFFGIRIRTSARELVILERHGGFFGFLFDLFFLPIIRAGRWMSMRAPRINVFIFFLDFIIEAPFKLAVEMVEGWVAFVREKKEEIE